MTEPVAGKAFEKLSDLNVLWVHNNGTRAVGMFMWDILDAVRSDVKVDEFLVSVAPSWKAAFKYCLSLRKASRQYDIVHAQYGSFVGFVASWSRCPVLLTLRGTDFYLARNSKGNATFGGYLRRLMTYVSCFRATAVTVMSDRMAHELRNWPLMKRKRIYVVPDAVGKMFVPDGVVTDSAFLFQEGDPLKVFVGSLKSDNPIKRTWILEKAANICCMVGVPVTLSVVSNVAREEVKLAIMAADVLASASVHEGWPNVVKEGLLCGLPYISTDVSDLREMRTQSLGSRVVHGSPEDFALAFIDASIYRRWKSPYCSFHPQSPHKKYLVLYISIWARK